MKDDQLASDQKILHIHKTIALWISLLFAASLLIVLAGANLLISRTAVATEKILDETITGVIAQSINRISFSGKHHPQLFIEQLTRGEPLIDYIIIYGADDTVIAKSTSHNVGNINDRETQSNVLRACNKGEISYRTRVLNGNSRREITMPYHQGYQNKIEGAIVVGIARNTMHAVITSARFQLFAMGSVIGLLSLILMILVNNKLSEPLRNVAMHMRGILDHSPLMVCIADRNLQFLQTSASLTRHLDVLSPILKPGITETFKQNKYISQEVEVAASADRTVRHYLISSFPLISDNSTTPRSVCSIVLDISQRKKADMELHRVRKILTNIVDSMPSMLVVIDHECKIILWNKEVEKITGIPAFTALGRHLETILPQLSGLMRDLLLSIRNNKIYHAADLPSMGDDPARNLYLTVYPLHSDDTSGAVIRIDDITERTKLQKLMIQSEKMISVGRLATGLAHEINNPLAGILQNTQVIMHRVTPGLKRNSDVAQSCDTNMENICEYLERRGVLKMLETILDSGKQAAATVTNLLSFSKRKEDHFRRYKISDILERSIELASSDYSLRDKFDFRDILVIREYEEPAPMLTCEFNMIQQVFFNILKNGAQAMRSKNLGEQDVGKPHTIATFFLRIAKKDTSIQIEIEDNGIGIPESLKKHLFEPFYHNDGQTDNPGLGLSVAYFIVSQTHGGEIEIDSEENKGTCVRITLPQRPPSI